MRLLGQRWRAVCGRRARRSCRSSRGVIRWRSAPRQGRLDDAVQVVEVDRLRDVVERSAFQGLPRRRNVSVRCHHDDRGQRPDPPEELEAVHAGHMEIQEHHVRARAGDDLRRTLASGAVQRSASLREVKESLGHSSPAMVIRYAHLSPEHLRRAVARLDGALADAVTASASAQISTQEPADLVGVPQKSLS